jgi:hypothetical protein
MASRKAAAAGRAVDQAVREHVLYLLRGGGAHLDFDAVIKSIPEKSRGKNVKGVPYTAWQVLEHMRIAQLDILEFSRDANHVSPEWPKGYWTKSAAPPDAAAWKSSVARFRKDLREIEKLIEDSTVDLYAPIPHGAGQTILREALLVADHNAYHLGQLALLQRLTKG